MFSKLLLLAFVAVPALAHATHPEPSGAPEHVSSHHSSHASHPTGTIESKPFKYYEAGPEPPHPTGHLPPGTDYHKLEERAYGTGKSHEPVHHSTGTVSRSAHHSTHTVTGHGTAHSSGFKTHTVTRIEPHPTEPAFGWSHPYGVH